MARIRTIKPEFPQSETIGRLSRDARLLFIQLWTIADDAGRCRATSRVLASLLYPYDDDAPTKIADWMAELERETCVRLYVVDGNTYLDIPGWPKHQRIDRPSPSKLPEYREPSPKPREEVASIRDTPLREGKGKEGKGIDLGPDQDSAAASAARRASKKKSPTIPGITEPPKYARRLDGGFETADGEYTSFEEAFWALKEIAANHDVGGSLMGDLARAHDGNFGAAYDALLLALKKSEPRRYVAGIVRKRDTERAHKVAAATGAAKPIAGDPATVPQWVLRLRGEGEIVTWSGRYWEHLGRGFDHDFNEVAG